MRKHGRMLWHACVGILANRNRKRSVPANNERKGARQGEQGGTSQKKVNKKERKKCTR